MITSSVVLRRLPGTAVIGPVYNILYINEKISHIFFIFICRHFIPVKRGAAGGGSRSSLLFCFPCEIYIYTVGPIYGRHYSCWIPIVVRWWYWGASESGSRVSRSSTVESRYGLDGRCSVTLSSHHVYRVLVRSPEYHRALDLQVYSQEGPIPSVIGPKLEISRSVGPVGLGPYHLPPFPTTFRPQQ